MAIKDENEYLITTYWRRRFHWTHTRLLDTYSREQIDSNPIIKAEEDALVSMQAELSEQLFTYERTVKPPRRVPVESEMEQRAVELRTGLEKIAEIGIAYLAREGEIPSHMGAYITGLAQGFLEMDNYGYEGQPASDGSGSGQSGANPQADQGAGAHLDQDLGESRDLS